MPIASGWSRSVVSANVAREMEAGRPQAQGVAIALRSARRSYRARHPLGPFPKHLQMTSTYRMSRSMNRIESKKHVCRCDAYQFPHAPGGGACSTNRAGGKLPAHPIGDPLLREHILTHGGDYVLIYGGGAGRGFSVSQPYVLKKMAIDEARALSRPGSYGGEVGVAFRDGTRTIDVGRALDGQFHAADSSANRAGSLNMVKWSRSKKVITLGRKDTKLWQDGGPDGHEFRARIKEMAQEQADRSRESVEIYASASAGGWMAEQIQPEPEPDSSANRAGSKSIDRWTERYGGAENARAAGVTGRLAEVSDGTYTYVESTGERSAKVMLRRFASTADYYNGEDDDKVTLYGRIVAADGSEIDSAKLIVEPDHGTPIL